MKNGRNHIVAAFIILILFAAVLSGCGVKKLSGTYVSEQDSTEYLKFSGESKVSLYNKQGRMDGAYRIIDDLVLLSFNTEEDSNSTIFLEIENKKTLYYGMTAYVKAGFWKRYWKRVVIGILIFGLISFIYKKITGRELADDIEKWGDNLGD